MRRHTRRGSPCGCPPWPWTVAGRYRRLTRPNARATMSPCTAFPPPRQPGAPPPKSARSTVPILFQFCSNLLTRAPFVYQIRSGAPPNVPRPTYETDQNGTEWNTFSGSCPPDRPRTPTLCPCCGNCSAPARSEEGVQRGLPSGRGSRGFAPSYQGAGGWGSKTSALSGLCWWRRLQHV